MRQAAPSAVDRVRPDGARKDPFMKTRAVILIATLAACGGAPIASDPSAGGGSGGHDLATSVVTLRNATSYAIYELHLAPVDTASWGANLLRGDVLLPGEMTEISVFDCNDYDLRLVDDEGEECVLERIELCFQDEDWVLDDTALALCTIFS
jgi:hypothetical protein